METPSIQLWGDSFIIQFAVSLAQPPVDPDNITWTFRSTSGGEATTLVQSARYSFSEDRKSLTISGIMLEDEGVYTMKAENPGGADAASAELEVRGEWYNPVYIYMYMYM